ncbi:Transcription factor bHLH167 [Vitis vinifera]|uniref:Transcription factor bHLH167 n=1 Tax=Vitis vinifera TaxID=29760 RepID=A0A438JNV4_VITVI|nr:Transcription factor bHLH167 [Vitis vinifera]
MRLSIIVANRTPVRNLGAKLAKEESMPRQRSNLSKLDRSAVERNRRMHMKDLFSRLAFLVPTRPSKSSLHVSLDHATTYIKQLQKRIETLKQTKQLLQGSTDETGGVRCQMSGASRSPVITVRDMGSSLELLLISGSNKKFRLHEVISVLEEEAAQVVTVNQCIVGDRICYSIHSEAVSSRIGVDASRVHERLKELIF